MRKYDSKLCSKLLTGAAILLLGLVLLSFAGHLLVLTDGGKANMLLSLLQMAGTYMIALDWLAFLPLIGVLLIITAMLFFTQSKRKALGRKNQIFLLVVFAITLLFFLFKGIWWGKGFQNFK